MPNRNSPQIYIMFIATMTCYSSLVIFLFLHGVFLTEALNSGFSVELIHLDSPRSPFFNPMETQFQRLSNGVHRSVNRSNYFNKSSSSNPTNTPESTVTPGIGDYLMTYSVGTPPFKVYGFVDTASDIVWLQCKPCKKCYNQTSPIFDPSKSSTYKPIPCPSATCNSIPNSFCLPNHYPNCRYFILYGDHSQSNGDLSVESLTLDSTNGSDITFPRITIGCGQVNTGTFSGISSGIVGLGGGATSLITQLGSSIGGKFSYCLVPKYLESNFSSKLNFGDAAVVSGLGTISTPIIPSDNKSFYQLTLEAFSVGDKRIEFGGSSSRSGKQGNIIIDSGSTMTILPNDVYSRLESAVANVVKLQRVKGPTQEFSLCYKTTSKQLEVPVITAHFSGANVKLNALNTFFPIGDGVVCFAFASLPNYNDSIFGNLAQQNLLVGYDLRNMVISFKPTDCTKE